MKYSLIIRFFILFCITNSCIQVTKCFAQTQSLRITARFKNVFHVPFKILEVVDNRNTSNTIAIYNTGFDNLPMVQNFTTLFDVDFLDYVNYSYVMQDTVEVKIVLYEMKISMRKESINTSTYASADFSFYIKKNEKWEFIFVNFNYLYLFESKY